MINKKKCWDCKATKNLDLFYRDRAAKDGRTVRCKECSKKYRKRYYQTDKGKEVKKRYDQTDKGKECQKEYRQSKKNKKYQKEYRQSEKGKAYHKVYRKEYRQSDKGKKALGEGNKRYYQTDKGKEANKRYYQTDKGKKTRNEGVKKFRQSEKGREWFTKQSVEHTQYAIRSLLRNRVRRALNQYTKTGKIMSSKKYGISYEDIIKHLGPHPNSLGTKGKFHIDHIIPLSSCDLNDLEQIKIAFVYENHHWLTARENLVKGVKIIQQEVT